MVAIEEGVQIRGAVLRLWEEWQDHNEVLVDGKAGTGKSFQIAIFIDWFAREYPGARILVVRKARASLTESWMQTFRKAMAMLWPRSEFDHLFQGPTDENRRSYDYSNGSRIVLGGIADRKDTRLFSTEYDIIYVNEATELTLGEWEKLNRACRNTVTPHNLLFGDCNPDARYHWLNQRCIGTALEGQPENGRTKRFKSHFEDNPWLTDTESGRAFIARLRDQLTGVDRERLYLGLWVSSEGAVYPQFSSHSHVIRGLLHKIGRRWFLDITAGFKATVQESQRVEMTWFFASADWGTVNPGCLLVWGVDREGRMYLVEEWYHSHKMRTWFAEKVAGANKKFSLWKVVCDNAEPDAIQVFNDYLSWDERLASEPLAIGCKKTRTKQDQTNIDLFRDKLSPMADGHPGIFFLENARRHAADPKLLERAIPTRTVEEVPSYSYRPVDPGGDDRLREEPVKKDNHGINATEYAVRYAHGRDLTDPKGPAEWSSPDALGAVMELDPEEWLG